MHAKLSLLSFLLFLFTCNFMSAQYLQTHQWKNRIVLVFTQDLEQEKFKQQIKQLKEDEKGLMERKLIVYQVTPTTFQLSDGKKVASKELYRTYFRESKDFQVILIGLDGGVKMSNNQPVTVAELFGEIDRMPMRRSEMRTKIEE